VGLDLVPTRLVSPALPQAGGNPGQPQGRLILSSWPFQTSTSAADAAKCDLAPISLWLL
jgi:hypothetical protein